jgi:hypothetical protein
MIDNRFSVFFAFGDLTTMIKSYSAFGPSLSVILLVSSFEIGFSIYQDSCLISLLTMISFFLDASPGIGSSGSIENGNSGLLNLSINCFLLY